MKPMSRLLPSACVAVLLCAVAGCDEQPAKPAAVPVIAPPAPVETKPASSEAAPSGYSVTSPVKAAPIKPVQQNAAVVAKATATQPPIAKPEPSKPVVKATASKPVSKPAREKSVVERKLPPIKLDLSLPRELVEDLHHGEPLVEEKPLLPPLFVEKEAKPAPFQLSGKLITNEHERDKSGEKLERDNYFDKVDGAQLNFEFRN